MSRENDCLVSVLEGAVFWEKRNAAHSRPIACSTRVNRDGCCGMLLSWRAAHTPTGIFSGAVNDEEWLGT